MKKPYTEAVTKFTPLYDYEREMTPYLSAIRSANLTPERIAWSLRCRADWSHDDLQNWMVMPPEIKLKLKANLKKREHRRNPDADYSPTSIFHRRISQRTPGTFLARQKEIDFKLLAAAHRIPGCSMVDNLRRCTHPSAARLVE